jgi:hypothetical protein
MNPHIQLLARLLPFVAFFQTAVIAQTLPDQDLDRLPDAWENTYGLNALSENFTVGSTADGNLTIPAGSTVIANPISIPITTCLAAGATEIFAAIPIGVAAGDLLLLHVTQAGAASVGSPVGTWEIVTVATKETTRVTLRHPLQKTYDPATGTTIQCIRVPQYYQLTVDGTLTANAWDGSKGGIVAIVATDIFLHSSGSISADSKGFRGGDSATSITFPGGATGCQGESLQQSGWPTPRSTLNNIAGGGGGSGALGDYNYKTGYGGGGGGNGLQGNDAYDFSASYPRGGQGGSPAGTPTTALLYCGSGGGAGGVVNGYGERVGGNGGAGGGIVLILSRTLVTQGYISSSGGIGGRSRVPLYMNNGNWVYGSSGGGGAGGMICIASRLIGSGSIGTSGGKSGEASSSAGDGSPGRIRIERNPLPTTGMVPAPFGLGVTGTIPPEFNSLINYADQDGDGLSDYEEYLAGTSPILRDTDADGVPDAWEVKYGTPPNVADADADPDHDGRTNIQEYFAGSHPNSGDGDGDGVPDIVEINTYGTNPLLADTDGDGIDDAWEIVNDLNPLVSDANGDLDLDGLTNKEEYDQRANGYKANAFNSLAGTPNDDHQSDYRRLKGEGWVRHRYDRSDRLIATERDNRTVQLYTYDGNSQKRQDILNATLDADGDGLPDAWEFANNLAYTGTGAATGNNGPLGDPDGDGFTNEAEWRANTNPKDPLSHPTSGAIFASTPTVAPAGFTPTNWVMATGQLDGFGPDEVVLGADGAIGTANNSLSILTKGRDTWSALTVLAGNAGITSLATGVKSTGSNPSIFIGTRPSTGSGTIAEFSQTGLGWNRTTSPIATTSGLTLAQVIGLWNQSLLTLQSPSGLAADGIYKQSYSTSSWSTALSVNNAAGKRDWSVSKDGSTARWLDGGGIQVTGLGPDFILAPIQRPGSQNWYFLTPNALAWDQAEAYAAQCGGHLVTIEDATENAWLWSQYSSEGPWIGLFRDQGSNITTGWKWTSGSISPFRSWNPNQPDYANGTELYAHFYVNSNWNDLPINSLRKGIVEIDATTISARTVPDPSATSKLIWRGHSLALGTLRTSATNATSLTAAFIDDNDSSGTAGSGDEFVVLEYYLDGVSSEQRTSVRLPLTSPNMTGAYGLTTLRRADATKPAVLAIGEPDGTVSLWTAPDATSPLVRRVFDTSFKGKSWHQFEPLREANGREGLVGLLVDPATPGQCQVIHWSPEVIEAALNGTAPVLNNLPLAHVLPSPSSGGSPATVGVRAWDAEAHSSKLTLQFQTPGQSIWSNVRLLSADGSAANLGTLGNTTALATAPGGLSHSLVWNAAADLGSSFVGTVLLRTMATDTEAGVWSDPMPYAIDLVATLDSDGDGFTNSQELAFGTDPNSAASRPVLTAVRNPNGSLQLTWPTAVGKTYRLETSTDLTVWTTQQSGLTTNTLSIPLAQLSAPKRFYRIAAE